MRSIIFAALLITYIINYSYGQTAEDDSTVLPDLREELNPVLRGALLSINDLKLRGDYLEKDSMRLLLVDDFMSDPFMMESYGEKIYKKLLNDPSMVNLVAIGAKMLYPLSISFNPKLRLKPILVPHDFPGRGLKKYVAGKVKLSQLPEDFRSALDIFLHAVEESEKCYNLAFMNTPRDSIIYGLTLLLTDDELNEKKSVEELDSLGDYSEEWAKALAVMLPRFELGQMLNGAGKIAISVDKIVSDSIKNYYPAQKRQYPIELESRWGKIALGTENDDSYHGKYLLILDPGGNDSYQLTSEYGWQTSVIIDYNGNDIYKFTNDSLYTFTETAKILNYHPPGIGGYRYLIDYEGDDIYNGDDFTLAAGIFGVSILKDYRGDDTYITDTFGPGAGSMGIGILLDFEGRDNYNGAMYNEGFGFTGGVGILFDGEGQDNYISGGKYGDILRYVDHYITFSQGSAYGLRPYLSGGIGLLLDGSGNDLYVSDIFGQASGYWYSAGIIYDRTGNDRYQSFQYAQGSGTHMAVGCLRDDSGDDIYFSKGVSQGCGHDYAHGWLVDYAGNDVYSAYDLSQGAGSANGIGAIVDFAGDDRYYVKSERNTQGYGNPRRDYGSIGLFFDASGTDRYDGGRGSDDNIWIYSKWGIGWDVSNDSTK